MLLFGTPSASQASTPAHIANATAGEWTAIGTNALEDVAYDYGGSPPSGFTTDITGMIHAWSGGVYDPTAHKLYVHGGGHESYDGNEWYAFDLANNQWERVNNPTLEDPEFEDADALFETDGTPFPIHTYDSLGVNPDTGKLYRLGAGGSNVAKVWEFNPANDTWTGKTADNQSVPSMGCDWMSDESKFIVCYQDSGSWRYFRRYDPSTDSWSTEIETSTAYSGNVSLAYSASRDLAVVHHLSTSTNTWLKLDTSTDTPSSQTITGATLPDRGGLEYDSSRDLFVLYTDEGANRKTLYEIDPDTWVASTVTPSTGATPSAYQGTPTYNGIYGRFRYCSDYNVFIMVNNEAGNVYLYKPSA